MQPTLAKNLTRFASVACALGRLGGQARPAEIAEEIRRTLPGPHPNNLLQSVRARIQECSSDSKFWKGKRDLFYSVHGIGGGVWGLRSTDPLNPANHDGFADSVEPYMANEGAAVLRTHLRRERSRSLINRFKRQLSSYACLVCGFDFADRYGQLGVGFIEAHHKVPVAKLVPGTKTSLADLAPVCSNCHSMLHRSSLLSIEELKELLNH